MKLKSLFLLLIFVAISVALIVSCNFDLNNNQKETIVTFAPAATKSLNQSATAQSVAGESVNLYHWE